MKIPIPDEVREQIEETARVMKEMNRTLIRVEKLLEQMLDRLPQV